MTNIGNGDDVREGLQAALGSGYTLGPELGGGGMSRVFVARDEQLGRDIVVKLLSPALAQEFSVERFAREIRLAANLQHAHIVPLLSAGATAAGLPYYLMPFVEGESLRHRVAGGALPIDEVVLVLKDVSRALAYAHARGVVHRDIKPDNVMLSGGAAVVTDFGIAKAVTSARTSVADDSLTRMGMSLGTPSYMAPEQGAGDPDTDHRADIYALGAMAYELLTGAPPFAGKPAHALLVAHLTEKPAPVAQKRPDVPAPLAALVMQCLAKDPAERPQTAADVLAALDDAARTGASAAPSLTAPGRAGGARSTRTLAVAALLVALVAAGAFAAWRFFGRAPTMEATRIAVMPFNVREPSLAMWSEGLVDVLSRSLDGAGALRTVAPSAIIGQGSTRADAASAATLGRSVGAGLVLFGDVNQSGPDSVHLRAAVFDVADGKVRHDIEVRGEATRMDALADSLALRVLRELGAAGGLGSRLYSVGTRSLPALKAFLQGQQFYRRGQTDSARMAFQRSVELDSTFSLGWRGVASIYIRTGRENEPAAQHALDRAIQYKSGRSPRDSLLLRADSLRLAVTRRQPGTTDALDPIPQLPLLYETLRHATEQYSSDPELWYEYGDAIFHFGHFAGVPRTAALAVFDRGIALDSSAVVPYFHAMEIALQEGNFPLAARYARRMSVLLPGENGASFRLQSAVLDTPARFGPETRALLDSLPARHAANLMGTLATVPDSAGRALALARLQQERPSPILVAGDSTALTDAIAFTLAAHGRFRDALASRRGPLPPSLYLQIARLGGIPRDSALATARRWARSDPRRAYGALRLFADAGDTASLALVERFADSVTAATPEGSIARSQGVGGTLIARHMRTLARGDSAAALRGLLAIPMAQCSFSPCAGTVVAELLMHAGRHHEAARVLDRTLPSLSLARTITLPIDLLLRARLAERIGDEERAASLYRRVTTLWAGGDPAVQPALREAKEALGRLAR